MDSIFLGQIIFNISVLTQLGIFITVLCDIIQTISFGYEWQYAIVAIIIFNRSIHTTATNFYFSQEIT